MLSVPAVTMNMGGMAELVEDGVTGVLAKSACAEDFAAAVRDILSDGERLGQMKQNCAERARNDLSVEEYCAELIKIYGSARGKNDA